MRKTISVVAIIIFSYAMIACNFVGNNPQSDINVKNRKEQNTSELGGLLKEGKLSDKEYNLILDRLNADCDTYLSSDGLTCEQISAMAAVAMKEMDSIKITEKLCILISETYSTIAVSNQVRNIYDIKEYCIPVKEIWDWYDSCLTTEDRFSNLRDKVKTFVANEADNKSISLKGMDSIARTINDDIDFIAQNLTDTILIRRKVSAGLSHFSGRDLDNSIIMGIGNLYSGLAKIGRINIETEADKFFADNLKQPEPLSYEELRASVESRLDWMLEKRLVSKRDHEKLKTTMLDDIDTFLKGSQTKEQLTARAKQSLDKLKDIHLDTEDREFVAETYYDIAGRCDIDIADMLNNWMYSL